MGTFLKSFDTKLIVSSPFMPLESNIACRSEPRPESPIVVTVKVAALPIHNAKTENAANKNLSFIASPNFLRRVDWNTHGIVFNP